MGRVSFFIDGFNVFHSLDSEKQYHKYKWLDYSALAKCFISSKDVVSDIFYFTAYAHWDPTKKARHQLLVRAE